MTMKTIKHKTKLSLAGALTLFIGFACLAPLLVMSGKTGMFDEAVSRFFYSLHNPVLNPIMVAITWAGSGGPVILGMGYLVYRALKVGDRKAAVVLPGMAIINQTANTILKLIIARPRPDLLPGVKLPSSFAFPSGHAMAAAAVVGLMGVILVRLKPHLAKPVAIITPLLILLIGLSRIYLGVHWPTDVIGGFILGTGVFLVGLAALGRFPPPPATRSSAQ